MKLLMIADWHFDFWQAAGRDPFAELAPTFEMLDLLVLAGDISNKPRVRWPQAFAHLSRYIDPYRVAVFPGNHDYYDFRLDGEDRLAGIAAQAGVRWAQTERLDVGDVRLLMATLWTDLALGPGARINAARVQARMNDYRKIRVGHGHYRRLWPSDTVAIHCTHRKWLEAELSKAHTGRTIVITHHAPHPRVLQDYSEGLDAAYASDLETMIRTHAPDFWFFGHSHDARDLEIGSTNLRCVSLGYPDEVDNPKERIERLVVDL